MRVLAGYTLALTFSFGATLLVPQAGWAAPNRDVTAANALYGAGNYQEALDAYNRLAEERPESPELQFNRGAAYYQLGDMAKAREAFEQAGVLAEDASLQALSAYNLGNVAFKDGQTKAAENPEEAIEALNQSLGHYKEALARDRSLDAAANNLEMAKRTIQELRQQMRQQEQQQQQEQQKKDEAKQKLDELIEEQEQQNQQSDQAADQQQRQQQDPNQPGPTPEQLEAMKKEQEQTRDKTEALAEQLPEPEEAQPKSGEDAKSKAEEAAKKQQEAEEHLKKQDAQAANKAQDEALEKLKEAREAMDAGEEQKDDQEQQKQDGDPSGEQKSEQQDQQQPQDQQPGEEHPPQDPLTAEKEGDVAPPDATAKDILNMEQQNKEQRIQKRMVRARPVDKDW